MRKMSTALLIGVLSFGINSAADAQIGTIQLSPNVGLDFSTSGWTPLGYGIDPYSPTGSLGFDRGSSILSGAPGGTISGTYTASITAYGPPIADDSGTINVRIGILAYPDGTELWASPTMSVDSGNPTNVQNFSYQIPPFAVPANGQMEVVFWSTPSGKPGGGWGGQDPGFQLSEFSAVPPPPPPVAKLTPQQKQRYKNWSDIASKSAAAVGAATTVSPLPPFSKIPYVALGVSLWWLHGYLDQMVQDPVDTDYMEIAQPVALPLPLGGRCVRTLGAEIVNLAALAQAASTSFSRMQGAIQAGDDYWTQQQGQALTSYAAQVDAILPTLRPHFIRCFPVRGTVSAADVVAYQQNLVANGLDQVLMAGLTAEGITDPNDQQDFLATLISQDAAITANLFNAMFGDRADRLLAWQTAMQAIRSQQ